MKIAAYLFASISALIWGVLMMFAVQYLRYWWQRSGAEPYGGGALMDVTMILAPFAGFATAICCLAFLRNRAGQFFAASCCLLAITLAGGTFYVGLYGAGV